MRFEKYEFGSIKIDDITYEHDVVIDHGEITKRQKKRSKKSRWVRLFCARGAVPLILQSWSNSTITKAPPTW